MKYQIILTLLLITILFACYEKTADAIATKTIDIDSCNPYFSFDQAIHYNLQLSDDEATKIAMNQRESLGTDDLYVLIFADIPRSLSDTQILSRLLEFNYSVNTIPSKKFDQINMIFCDKKNAQSEGTMCVPKYRDIVIFKKANKITGLAKLCFDCNLSFIIGAKGIPKEFGRSDYENLKLLLRRDSL